MGALRWRARAALLVLVGVVVVHRLVYALAGITLGPRAVPRAIRIAIAVVGGFSLLPMAAQTLGYGTDDADIARFEAAASPYGDLGEAYVGSASRSRSTWRRV